MGNKFLVSVANAVLRDPNTLAAIALGKTNITSSLTLAMAATEVRGGINNPLLYSYYHDRKADFKIEEVTFDKNILALNLGSTIVNGAYTVVYNEGLVLSGGSAVVTKTPLGNVTVFLPNDTVQTVTPTSGSITVSGGGNQKVQAVYTYTATADQIVATSTTPPTLVDLTLIAEVRDETGVITDYLQINVPRYQISGNYTLALAANGVSQQALDGTALVTTSTDASADYYFKATWIPQTAASIPVSSIAATPTVTTFSVAGGKPQSKQVNMLGIRGGLFANANITLSCSYVRSSGCVTISAGSNTGLVTAGSSFLAGESAVFTATYYDTVSGSLTDTFNVTCTA
jgi:hypothetical protein